MKPMTTNIIIALVTALLVGIGTWAITSIGEGQDALSDQHIEDVVKDMLVRENGDTYGKSLASIDLALTTLVSQMGAVQTDVGEMKDDLDDMEQSVREMVAK